MATGQELNKRNLDIFENPSLRRMICDFGFFEYEAQVDHDMKSFRGAEIIQASKENPNGILWHRPFAHLDITRKEGKPKIILTSKPIYSGNPENSISSVVGLSKLVDKIESNLLLSVDYCLRGSQGGGYPKGCSLSFKTIPLSTSRQADRVTKSLYDLAVEGSKFSERYYWSEDVGLLKQYLDKQSKKFPELERALGNKKGRVQGVRT